MYATCHNARGTRTALIVPALNFCELCNTSIPVPELFESSVRLPYPYQESTNPAEHKMVDSTPLLTCAVSDLVLWSFVRSFACWFVGLSVQPRRGRRRHYRAACAGPRSYLALRRHVCHRNGVLRDVQQQCDPTTVARRRFGRERRRSPGGCDLPRIRPIPNTRAGTHKHQSLESTPACCICFIDPRAGIDNLNRLLHVSPACSVGMPGQVAYSNLCVFISFFL